ncbi:MAG: prolipoprotein diacylglyceryl transferase [Chloroflexi bacterium]|nr:prolipoprotein diacylglyceryl transferase [Chloroflexota bacterium]
MLTLFRNLFAPPRHMILLVIAAWIGLSLAEKRSERHGLSADQLNTLTFYGLLAFILGGRLSFVLQNLPSFMKSPAGIISINPDIFDPIGALAAAAIVALIHAQRQNISLWNSLDALTPFFAVLAVGLGCSQLAAGTAFGMETSLPWGIDLWNATRHPTQVYQMIASLLTLLLLWFKRHDPRPGILFLLFAALTAGSQLFIQAFRGDATFILNGMRQSQITAWLALFVVFILLEIQLKKTRRGTR